MGGLIKDVAVGTWFALAALAILGIIVAEVGLRSYVHIDAIYS
jgi:hypothetical protein